MFYPRVPEEKIQEVRQLYRDGTPIPRLVEKYDVSRRTITRWLGELYEPHNKELSARRSYYMENKRRIQDAEDSL